MDFIILETPLGHFKLTGISVSSQPIPPKTPQNPNHVLQQMPEPLARRVFTRRSHSPVSCSRTSTGKTGGPRRRGCTERPVEAGFFVQTCLHNVSQTCKLKEARRSIRASFFQCGPTTSNHEGSVSSSPKAKFIHFESL